MALACTQEEIDVLTMGSSEVKVPYEGVEKTLEFTASTAWTIESDQDWVSFDQTEGVAGDVTVVMTVAANTTYENRTAVVTISAGDKITTITLQQGFATEFASEHVYEIDAEAQTIEFDITTNLEYSVEIEESAKSWISSVSAKSAPASSKLVFDIKANTELGTRTGKIYVKTGAYSQCLVVKQSAEFVEMSAPNAVFLGRTMDAYDDNVSDYIYYNEYAITFETEDGTVTLALNYPYDETDPLAAVPAGEFVVDAAAAHADYTFSVAKSEKYYTNIMKNDSEIVVEDGEISVEVADGQYTVIATLVDGLENLHRYSYVGAIESIEDNSHSLLMSSASFMNTYYTHFSSGANQWSVTLQLCDRVPGFEEMNATSFTLYLLGNTGDVDYNELPTGTFTIVEDEYKEIDSPYSNGKRDLNTGDAYMSVSAKSEGNNYTSGKAGMGGTITIAKNADGTYNFDLDVKINYTTSLYDDEYNYLGEETKEYPVKTSYENIVKSEVSDTHSRPVLDGDDTFSSIVVGSYTGFYWGDAFGTGGSVLSIAHSGSMVNANYEITLSLHQDTPYVYEKNYANRFCNTPIATGTYEFAAKPEAGKKSLLPLKYGTASRSYIKNGYTGSSFVITGGSVDITSTSITYNNVTATNGTETYTFNGSYSAAVQMFQDYSAESRVSKLSLAE